jgi:hypothetical protein
MNSKVIDLGSARERYPATPHWDVGRAFPPSEDTSSTDAGITPKPRELCDRADPEVVEKICNQAPDGVVRGDSGFYQVGQHEPLPTSITSVAQ